MKLKFYSVLVMLTLACMVAPSFAMNITINDLSSRKGWIGIEQGLEDEETEPGMVNSQVWDLEGFFFENDILSLVGGYDFLHGVDGIKSGDIFLSTFADGPEYTQTTRTIGGDKQQTVLNKYDYNYVIDLDFTGNSGSYTYKVYAIDANTVVMTALYDENEGSSPWQYDNSYKLNDNNNFSDSAIASGTFTYQANYTGSDFIGDTHYLLDGFDLSFLGHGTEFYSHFTMGCGNDNLMGKGTVVPEPATLVLLGAGLLGLAYFKRTAKK